jgi:subtilisin family serine protease
MSQPVRGVSISFARSIAFNNFKMKPMEGNVRRTTIGFVTLCALIISGASLAADAGPYLDTSVRDFLAASNKKDSASFDEERLSVLLIYHRAAFEARKPSQRTPRFRKEFELGLRAQTKQMESEIFGADFMKTSVVRRSLWSVHGTATSLTRAQLLRLKKNPLISQFLDAEKPIRLKASVSMRGLKGLPAVPKYTDALKRIHIHDLNLKFPQIDGNGVRVGIIDTGIDDTHPDLKGKLNLYQDFSPAKNPLPADGFGHGTHVAGTIAGGAASGTIIGVAPKVDLVVARIFDGNGNSTREGILAAMQWIADPDGDPSTADQPQVVNNSWSDDDPYKDREFKDEPFCTLVDVWVALGIVPIFSAGNTGPSDGTINLPAGCPSAIAVGATEQYDRSPWFSSSGPARWKSVDLVKPEVVAPGVDIFSAEPRGQYQMMTGTSMSAPHATGLVALILQANPTFTVAETTKALIDGVLDLGDPGKDNTFGWGRIDAVGSIH